MLNSKQKKRAVYQRPAKKINLTTCLALAGRSKPLSHFLVNGVLLQEGIILFYLKPVGGVPPVLHRAVTARSLAESSRFGAFNLNDNPSFFTFPCHECSPYLANFNAF
jgi:hypothetical protein